MVVVFRRDTAHPCGLMSEPQTREADTRIVCATSNNIAEHVIKEVHLEDNIHADTCMRGKGLYVTQNHNITCGVSGFTSSLGNICLEIVDAETDLTYSRGDECILIIHQVIYKSDEEQSHLSTFQTRWSGTRVESISTQHDKHSRFGLIFEREDLDQTLIPFGISGVSEEFHIRIPTDKDWERLPRYESTSKFTWYLSSVTHAGNEKSAQSKSTYDIVKPQWDNRIVNLSALWCRDVTELIPLYQE